MIIPVRRTAAAATLVATAAASISLLALAAPASAADCTTGCTVDFAPGAQTTWLVPADATAVTITVGGAGGGDNDFTESENGGAGGVVTTELGTAFNGQTLHILVGARGRDAASSDEGESTGEGGGGSFVAAPGAFLVVAGGGGGEGAVNNGDSLAGGDAGFASGTLDGADGGEFADTEISGSGATGTTPGVAASGLSVTAAGGDGTVASVSADGTVTPGVGGAAGEQPSYPVSSGGGGLAGGGGGGAGVGTGPDGTNLAGAGGGGSSYLADGLTASDTDGNVADGFVTITYTAPAAATAPTQVTPAATGAVTPQAELAETGVETWPAAIAAALAVALGALLVVRGTRVARRRG